MVLISNLKLSFLYCWWIVWTNSLINARYWSISFVYVDWSWFIKYFRISGRYDKKPVLEKSENSQDSSGEQFSTRLSRFQRRSFAEYIDLHSVFNILLISCVSKITAAKWGETTDTTNVSAFFSTLSLPVILPVIMAREEPPKNAEQTDSWCFFFTVYPELDVQRMNVIEEIKFDNLQFPRCSIQKRYLRDKLNPLTSI